MQQQQLDPFVSIRNLRRAGTAIAVMLIGGVGGWAVSTEIAGAVLASGRVITESKTKQVQHASGGIVGEILVRDGQRVEIGQVLVRLDATLAKTNRGIIEKRLTELLARRARLVAERDGKTELAFPVELSQQLDNADTREAMASEERLFFLRATARKGRKDQLAQRKAQIEQSITGIDIQSQAKADELKLIDRELAGARKLWKRGLMPISKLTNLERQATRLKGEHGNLIATIARARASIAETELQLVQVDQDLTTEVAGQLGETNARIGELRERKIAADDKLSRIAVRAPQAGIVHGSIVHTVGGVISPGDTIMEIVPLNEAFVVEAQVEPKDIDQLYPRQPATLRFSAFNQRTTPEVSGVVDVIAADTSLDQASGKLHYLVRLRIPEAELARLGNVRLVAGMPVETFIKTRDRNVLSYLLKPISDQLERAFRES